VPPLQTQSPGSCEGRFYPQILPRNLFSLRGVEDSLLTVMGNTVGYPRVFAEENGFDNGLYRGANYDYPDNFKKMLRDHFFINPKTYAAFEYDHDRIGQLKKLLADLRDEVCAIRLYVSPIHARQILSLQALGLLDTYWEWKRDLAKIVAEINIDQLGNKQVELWDFGGFNSITTEAVPVKGSNKKMNWYWDSSHFTSQTGDMIFCRIFCRDKTCKSCGPRDFGVLLTPLQVDTVIAADTLRCDRFRQENPDDGAEVVRIARITERVRERVRSRYEQDSPR
jgi:hypothetical protein